jgi:glycosyltransferase involved in cell wall biosynthesis
MALLEAAACGVPAVGTAVGVLPELGVPVTSEAELVKALEELWGDEPRRLRLGQMARQRVAEGYVLETAVDRFRALYAEAGTNWP